MGNFFRTQEWLLWYRYNSAQPSPDHPAPAPLSEWHSPEVIVHLLRWPLVLPAAIGIWHFPSRSLVSPALSQAFAIRGYVSCLCYNRSIQRLLDIIVHLSIAASAIAVWVSATMMTPSNKDKPYDLLSRPVLSRRAYSVFSLMHDRCFWLLQQVTYLVRRSSLSVCECMRPTHRCRIDVCLPSAFPPQQHPRYIPEPITAEWLNMSTR